MTIDPYAGYKTAVAGNDRRLRHATLIADHFHLIRSPTPVSTRSAAASNVI